MLQCTYIATAFAIICYIATLYIVANVLCIDCLVFSVHIDNPGNDSEKDDGSSSSNILAIVIGIIVGVAIIVIIVMCCVITTYCCLRYVAINHIFLCQYTPVRINTLLICVSMYTKSCKSGST